MSSPPSDLTRLLHSAPSGKDVLVELGRAGRRSPAPGADGVAAAVFRDLAGSLAWIPDRGAARATVDADGDTVNEIVVYVRLSEARRRAETCGNPAIALAPFAEAAVDEAADLEPLLVSGV